MADSLHCVWGGEKRKGKTVMVLGKAGTRWRGLCWLHLY